MQNKKLISVLKKVLKENERLSKKDEQIIRNFISKAEKEGISAQDIVNLTKNLFDIVKFIQTFLE